MSSKKNTNEIKTGVDTITIILLIIGCLSLISVFFGPVLFTKKAFWPWADFSEAGNLGSAINGLVSPFIAFAGVIGTALAFYVQFRANNMQVKMFKQQNKEAREQFEVQLKQSEIQFNKQLIKQDRDIKHSQFESKFYEMIRLHKDNVNEIELRSKNGEFIFKGRNAFFEMKKEIELLMTLVKNLNGVEDLDQEGDMFRKAYEFFFWGYNTEIIFSRKPLNQVDFDNDSSLESKVLKFKDILKVEIKNEEVVENVGEAFDAYVLSKKVNIHLLEGHHSYLGHYYRHLFLTVKFVVKSDIISDTERIEYLRLLRAQLSNYEQIMLFYNWLSSYGSQWENDENKFFTDFYMIHNLWYYELLNDKYVNYKLRKLVAYYRTLRRRTELFENGDEEVFNVHRVFYAD